MFQLSDDEKAKVIANCDHLEKLKFSRTNTYAFSEHGTIMLASVLHTPIAIQTSVLIEGRLKIQQDTKYSTGCVVSGILEFIILFRLQISLIFDLYTQPR